LALISLCTDRREAISEKILSSSRFSFLFSQKNLTKQFILIAQTILKLNDSRRKTIE
jgi:hypothetical protein